jgi:hypothetical protein
MMLKIEDDAMNYLHREMLRTLLRGFEKVLPKRQRLQAVRYAIHLQLELDEKENNQARVIVLKSLKLLIDRVKSFKELERLIAEKTK